jgi:hypothetical protein
VVGALGKNLNLLDNCWIGWYSSKIKGYDGEKNAFNAGKPLVQRCRDSAVGASRTRNNAYKYTSEPVC